MDDRKRRVSGKLAAIFIVIMLIAVPATATVITHNFMRADVTGAAPCFVKVAGADVAATVDVDFDNTTTIVGSSGVTFLQETISVTGYAGDRVTYSDVVRYQNTCDYDITHEDVIEGRHFDDDVMAYGFHDSAPRYQIEDGGTYGIPYRALRVTGIEAGHRGSRIARDSRHVHAAQRALEKIPGEKAVEPPRRRPATGEQIEGRQGGALQDPGRDGEPHHRCQQRHPRALEHPRRDREGRRLYAPG